MTEIAQRGSGSVISLRRYPVKSMTGEKLAETVLTQRGLLGDRAYALVDTQTGNVASGKNPRKWSRLLSCRSEFIDPPRSVETIPTVRITLPDGQTVASDQEDVHDVLSRFLGHQVQLTAAPPSAPNLEICLTGLEGIAPKDTVLDLAMGQGAPEGTFFDFGVVHIITTASLAQLQEHYPAGCFDERRFRPNIVVESAPGETGFVENEWIGHTIAIGDEVRLQVFAPTGRCVMTTLAQGDLPHDPGILRTTADHHRVHVAALDKDLPAVGVYANVLNGGTIRTSDSVRVE